jgi:valyl-tRNA synthetase
MRLDKVINQNENLVKNIIGASEIIYTDDIDLESNILLKVDGDCVIYMTVGKDVKEEWLKRQKEEIQRLKSYISKIESKLNNESFILKAPADVVKLERKKHKDLINKLKLLEK